MTRPDYEVAIIGAGPGGISAAHLLRQKGIEDFVIIERGDDFGGTWRDNHYPGLAVDISTLWYQLSFAPNPNWSRLFAPGPEIYRYLRDTASKLGLYDRLQANFEVVQQRWDETVGVWRLTVHGGPDITARFVISSVGGWVNAKHTVDIDGVEDFVGTILRPNAWDDGYQIRGKRIAIVGTGSSGVQIAAALSTEAEMLEVYQRTPAWVLPKVDFDIPPLMRAALRLPGVVPAVNVAGRALVPRYGIMAKRPVISSAFLSALNNPNTHLVTTPIERITRDGVRTVDGRDHPADLLVLATGYELWTDPETYRPGTVLGANGFDLAEYYRAHGPHSYAGTAHPRLPNPWEIVGPLGFVGFAWPCFVETTAAHAVRMIDETRRRGSHVAEVSQDAFNRWDATMARRGRTAHLYFTDCNPGLRTYFINSQRDTVYHRPQTITASSRFARRSPLAGYEFTRRTVQPTSAPLPKAQPA